MEGRGKAALLARSSVFSVLVTHRAADLQESLEWRNPYRFTSGSRRVSTAEPIPRFLTLIDVYSREALAVAADRSFPSRKVTAILDRTIVERQKHGH